MKTSWDAVLLAGGSGKRFQTDQREGDPKQFFVIGKDPIFIHSLRAFIEMGVFRRLVLVCPSFDVTRVRKLVNEAFPGVREDIQVVAGGKRRQDSSRNGLDALEMIGPPPDRVLIHDACRPYLSLSLRERVKKALENRSLGAWIPVIPVVETLKRVENRQVIETIDRTEIFRVQTPQVFEFAVIRSLMEKVRDSQQEFTDDASICEFYGIPVGVFEGDSRNIKLTYSFEVEILRPLLTEGVKSIPCEAESATTFIV